MGTVPGGVSGLAVGLDGRLYATLTTAQQVVELSATDGAVVRTLTDAPALPCPVSLATDPRTGDLFATSCVAVWRIASPATAPAVTRYARIADQDFPLTAITIGPDGTMFVVSPFGIYAIGSTASAPPTVQPISPLSGATGLAVATDGTSMVPSFLIVATADGAVFKVPGLGISSATTTLVLDGAGAGDQLSVGPDRCAYASLGASVLRVADASGLCALARAGVALPTITLANTTGQDAHVDGAFQTIQAQLAGSGVSDGTVVTFTVTGANGGVFQGTTVSGVATMSYRGHVVGTDTIVASATIGGFPITSAPLTLVWQRQIDLTAPTVAFTYSVPAGGTGLGFACPAVNSGMQTQVACGWFTKAPTIHWIVTANGSSGLGALTNCEDYTLNYQPSSDGHHQICSAANGDGQASANLTVIINAILTPPTITASATVNRAPYQAGTVTRGPVTVHFDCVSAIFNGILVCPPGETFSATGRYSGTAVTTDVAGQQAALDWGPVVVDATPPSVSAAYTLEDDPHAYAFGSWTNHNVVITFTCTDNDVVASCPQPIRLASSSSGVTVTASDRAGNVTTFTTAPVNIDKTPPELTAYATLVPSGAYTFGTPTNVDVVVHFRCTSDGAPITSCPSDQTLRASGSVTGTAVDAAGNTVTAVAGPVVIDRVPPTIDATLTVGGVTYDGSWTRGPVLVHFTCIDDRPGVVCPEDVVVSADGVSEATRTAYDAAGNSTSITYGPIRIDTTTPRSAATLRGEQAADGAYLFRATVTITARDLGSGVAAITYQASGAQTTRPITVPGMLASFDVTAEGMTTVTFWAVDAAGNVERPQSIDVTVIYRQPTRLVMTSLPLLVSGQPITARLTLADGVTPISGESVSFTAEGLTRSAITDTGGLASFDLGLAAGWHQLTISYAGSARYFPSDALSPMVLVFQRTQFVVWGGNAARPTEALPAGTLVQFWGAQWAKQVTRGDYAGERDFKGFAADVGTRGWSARPGDTGKPSAVPRFIAVIVTQHVTRSRDVTSGDIAAIALLDVQGEPSGRLSDKAYGRVVAVLRP